jgi:hypothetical protein
MKKYLKYLFIALLFIPNLSHATDYPVTCDGSADNVKVQAAVDAASDNAGDTVTIAAGSCAFANRVVWTNKNITVQGKGIGSTIITAATGITSVFAPTITNPERASFRITGMSMEGVSLTQGAIKITAYRATGYSSGWRIDNIKTLFTGYAVSVLVYGVTWGLIDNCDFKAAGKFILIDAVMFELDTAAYKGSYERSLDVGLGKVSAIYVENCTIETTQNSGGAVLTDIDQGGGSLVLRYNNIKGGILYTHWNRGSGEYGPKKYEVYNNILNGANATTGGNAGWVARIMGGTGVFFNNSVSNYSAYNTFFLDDNRATGANRVSPLYNCGEIQPPTNTWDGNLECANGTAPSEGSCGASTFTGWPCYGQVGRGKGTLGSLNSVPWFAWNNPRTGGGEATLAAYSGTSAYIKPYSSPHVNSDFEYYNATDQSDAVAKGLSDGDGGLYSIYICPHPLAGTGTCGAGAGKGAYSLGSVNPILISATLAADGVSLSLLFSRAITATINTGVTVTPSSGVATAAYASGTTTTTLVYTLSRAISSAANGGSLTVSYTQPGNGLEATDDGQDVLTFANTSVINNSTQGNTLKTVTPSASTGCHITPDTAQTIVSGLTAVFSYGADANYAFTSWGGTCGGSGTATYTTNAIIADCTVSVSCTKISPDVAIGSGAAVTLGSGAVGTLY